jgi:hypothetical protein
MQMGDAVVGIDMNANMGSCGGAVPFAPLGSGGGGSTASRASAVGLTGATSRPLMARGAHMRRAMPSGGPQPPLSGHPVSISRRSPYAPLEGDPVVGIDLNANMGACGGAVPFAPLGSGGGGSTASRASAVGLTGAGLASTPLGSRMRRPVPSRTPPSSAGDEASLIGKANAVANELGLRGSLPAVAAEAADILDIGLGSNGRTAAEIIDICYDRLMVT